MGDAAIEACERRLYDVVLMDVEMPDMDGIEATRVIREREAAMLSGHHTPIIAMTAHALGDFEGRCRSAGMNDFLTKPIQPARLFDALGQIRRASRRAPFPEERSNVMTVTQDQNRGVGLE